MIEHGTANRVGKARKSAKGKRYPTQFRSVLCSSFASSVRCHSRCVCHDKDRAITLFINNVGKVDRSVCDTIAHIDHAICVTRCSYVSIVTKGKFEKRDLETLIYATIFRSINSQVAKQAATNESRGYLWKATRLFMKNARPTCYTRDSQLSAENGKEISRNRGIR